MNKNRFCVVYSYKGSSNNFYWTDYNRFTKTEFDMCEFLEEIDGNPAQYQLISVWETSFDMVSHDRIAIYQSSHAGEKEFRATQLRDKRVIITRKLRENFNEEELGIIKNEKII